MQVLGTLHECDQLPYMYYMLAGMCILVFFITRCTSHESTVVKFYCVIVIFLFVLRERIFVRHGAYYYDNLYYRGVHLTYLLHCASGLIEISTFRENKSWSVVLAVLFW